MDEQEVVLSEKEIVGWLKSIRSLTPEQWADREIVAESTVKKSIGRKPVKADFKREGARKMGAIEWMMMALLVVLFFFSILHVFTWARNQAIASYATMHPRLEDQSTGIEVGNDGVTIGEDWYVLLHQISVLGVTELGMVALSIWHIYRAKFGGLPEAPEGRWLRKLPWALRRYFYMILAAACGIVVLGANLASGFDPVVSLLVPILTISLSEIFARMAGETYNENQEIDRKYILAVDKWQIYHNDPKTHPDYTRILTQEIQSWYRKNNAYKQVPWTSALLRFLSAREKATHLHAGNDDELVARFAAMAEVPLSDTAEASNGSSATLPPPSSPTPSEQPLEQSGEFPVLMPPNPSSSNGQNPQL